MEQQKFGKIPPNAQSKSRDAPKKDGKVITFSQEKKGRLMALMTYSTLHDIEEVLEYHKTQIRYWTAILHDKDIDKDGNPVTNHHHIVIEFYDPYEVKTIRNWFLYCKDDKGEYCTTLGQRVLDRRAVTDYLLHKRNPEKYQYPEEELVNYPDYCKIAWVSPRQDDQPALRIIEDMLNGTTEHELIQRYGREYIINGSRYREAISHMIEDYSLPDHLTNAQKTDIYYKYRRF